MAAIQLSRRSYAGTVEDGFRNRASGHVRSRVGCSRLQPGPLSNTASTKHRDEMPTATACPARAEKYRVMLRSDVSDGVGRETLPVSEPLRRLQARASFPFENAAGLLQLCMSCKASRSSFCGSFAGDTPEQPRRMILPTRRGKEVHACRIWRR